MMKQDKEVKQNSIAKYHEAELERLVVDVNQVFSLQQTLVVPG